MQDAFLTYLKTLKPDDWTKPVTPAWTVKDVVAHLLGWEMGDPEAIRQAWATKTAPWWESTELFDEFNRGNVERFRAYTSEQLMYEWEVWQKKVEDAIKVIGEDELRTYPQIFRWLFEGPNGARGSKHVVHHYEQIRQTVGTEQ